MWRIFGKAVALESGDTVAGRILARELSGYPSAAGPPDLAVRLGPVEEVVTLANPAIHAEGPDGFVAAYGHTRIAFSFDGAELRRITVDIPSPTRLRRGVQRWRNMQFTSAEEQVGQTVHELALVPAAFFDPDCVPVHAAGLRGPGGGAILFGGTGGTGKTSLELELGRSHGYDFLADDIGIVSRDGRVWPNLAYPKIYGYNAEGDPELRRVLFAGRGPADRIQWRIRGATRGLSSVRRRIAPAELYGGFAREAAPLTHYFLLVRESRRDLETERLDPAEAAALSVAVMMSEYPAFLNHLYWHEYNRRLLRLGSTLTVRDLASRWERVLGQVLESVPTTVLRIPRDMPHREFRARGAEIVADHVG